MTSKTKLACTTLGLSLLVLLPFLAHFFLLEPYERRAPGGDGSIAELIARERYVQAYRLLLRLNPEELDPREQEQVAWQLTLCELFLDRPDRAYARLSRLEHAFPLLEDYRRFWMARSLEEMDEREGAIAAYEDFLLTSRHRDLNNSARLRLAALYTAAADYDSVLRIYRQVLQSAYDRVPEVLYLMAQVHDRRGDRAAARRRRLQLLEDYPDSRRALEAIAQLPRDKNASEAWAVAVVYFEHQRHRQAIQSCKRFLRAYPRHQLTEEVNYLLGRAYLVDGQYDKARQAFAQVYERYGRPSALLRIGGVLVRRNQEEEAIATYEEFVRRFPLHDLAPEALWQAAKAAERNNHFDVAENSYRRLADTYPDSPYRDEAGWSIGFTFYCREEYEKALVVFQRLSQMAREPHIVDQSLFWAGKTAERLGQDDQARTYYRRAARGFPRSYYSARAVALGYLDEVPLKPRPSMALRAPAATAAPIDASARYLQRAQALYRLGLPELARRELQTAEHLNENDIDVLRTIRDRYEAFGFWNWAMRLSTRIFVSNGGRGEIHHIYPNYYWDQIVQAAGEAKIDPYLVLSVIRQESSFKEDAVSRAGALGLMQIMPQTGRLLARSLGMRRFERRSLLDPEISIRLGSRFLGDQVRQFAAGPARDMGFELGLAAYNAGPHNARQWLERFPHEDPDAFVERIPYRETRLYVKLVLKNYTIYKALSDV